MTDAAPAPRRRASLVGDTKGMLASAKFVPQPPAPRRPSLCGPPAGWPTADAVPDFAPPERALANAPDVGRAAGEQQAPLHHSPKGSHFGTLAPVAHRAANQADLTAINLADAFQLQCKRVVERANTAQGIRSLLAEQWPEQLCARIRKYCACNDGSAVAAVWGCKGLASLCPEPLGAISQGRARVVAAEGLDVIMNTLLFQMGSAEVAAAACETLECLLRCAS